MCRPIFKRFSTHTVSQCFACPYKILPSETAKFVVCDFPISFKDKATCLNIPRSIGVVTAARLSRLLPRCEIHGHESKPKFLPLQYFPRSAARSSPNFQSPHIYKTCDFCQMDIGCTSSQCRSELQVTICYRCTYNVQKHTSHNEKRIMNKQFLQFMRLL